MPLKLGWFRQPSLGSETLILICLIFNVLVYSKVWMSVEPFMLPCFGCLFGHLRYRHRRQLSLLRIFFSLAHRHSQPMALSYLLLPKQSHAMNSGVEFSRLVRPQFWKVGTPTTNANDPNYAHYSTSLSAVFDWTKIWLLDWWAVVVVGCDVVSSTRFEGDPQSDYTRCPLAHSFLALSSFSFPAS